MGVANFLAQEGGYQSGGEFTPSVVLLLCARPTPVLIGIRAEGGVQLRAGNEYMWPGTPDRSPIWYPIRVCVQEIN